MKQLVLTASIFAALGFGLMAQSRQSLSLEEAANLLLANNNTIKISQKYQITILMYVLISPESVTNGFLTITRLQIQI